MSLSRLTRAQRLRFYTSTAALIAWIVFLAVMALAF